jgi:hypothetical protein
VIDGLKRAIAIIQGEDYPESNGLVRVDSIVEDLLDEIAFLGDDEVTETVYVYWYDHDCAWITKYCDEHHRAGANIPLDVLNSYVVKEAK